ncbi:MAG: DUF3187 family protein [Vibrio sp.]
MKRKFLSSKASISFNLLAPVILFSPFSHAEDFHTSPEPNAAFVQDFGPLNVLTQAPIQALGLSLKTRDAFGWKKGSMEIYGQATAASVWVDSDDYTGDFYQNDINAGMIYAPADNWKIDFSYLYRFAANNKLDPVVNGFHDAFGLSDNGRDDVSDDRFYIENKRNGRTASDFKGDTINSAFTLYVDRTVFESKRQALSLGGALYYNNVSSGTFENSYFEQALQMNYSFYLADAHRFYTSFNIVRHDTDGIVGLNLREYTSNGSVSYQYLINSRHSLLAEFRVQQGSVHDSDSELNKVAYEPILGYRYNLGFGAIEVSMTENIINSDNSADFAMSLGYRHRL